MHRELKPGDCFIVESPVFRDRYVGARFVRQFKSDFALVEIATSSGWGPPKRMHLGPRYTRSRVVAIIEADQPVAIAAYVAAVNYFAAKKSPGRRPNVLPDSNRPPRHETALERIKTP